MKDFRLKFDFHFVSTVIKSTLNFFPFDSKFPKVSK